MLVDSHCHLDRIDLTGFDGRLDRVLDAAAEQGVCRFLCVSIDLPAWEGMMAAVAPFENVWCSVGVHPNDESEAELSAAALVERARRDRVVAIGETGLDFHYGKEQQRVRQRERFRTHIRAARQCGLPLIVHTRDARDETIDILRQEGADAVGGVLHCFTEDLRMAERAMELNFLISFSGIVTFRGARELQRVASTLPLSRILVETDSPWLSPVPYRGKPNHPARVRQVAEFLAQLRDQPFEKVATETTENFQRLFRMVE